MNILHEFWLFLCEYKVYWLAPIVLVLLGVAVLLVFGGTPAGAFLYTLW